MPSTEHFLMQSPASDSEFRITVTMGLLLAVVGTAFFPSVYLAFRVVLRGWASHFANSAEIAAVVAMRFVLFTEMSSSSFLFVDWPWLLYWFPSCLLGVLVFD